MSFGDLSPARCCACATLPIDVRAREGGLWHAAAGHGVALYRYEYRRIRSVSSSRNLACARNSALVDRRLALSELIRAMRDSRKLRQTAAQVQKHGRRAGTIRLPPCPC